MKVIFYMWVKVLHRISNLLWLCTSSLLDALRYSSLTYAAQVKITHASQKSLHHDGTDLGHDRITKATQDSHPLGNPMSQQANSGFNQPTDPIAPDCESVIPPRCTTISFGSCLPEVGGRRVLLFPSKAFGAR